MSDSLQPYGLQHTRLPVLYIYHIIKNTSSEISGDSRGLNIYKKPNNTNLVPS